MTSADTTAIVLELNEKLVGARIRNIYQPKKKTLLVRIHQTSQPAFDLLIEAGRRMHLTSYDIPVPQRPSAFSTALRKHLRNGVLTEINQHEFERIIIIEVRNRGANFKLVIELFGDGNIILVDDNGIILQALTLKTMRDRAIQRQRPFIQAPSSGMNPLEARILEPDSLTQYGEMQVVKALTKLFSLGGEYAEEILLRAQVSKAVASSTLNQDDVTRILKAIKDIFSALELSKLKPCVLRDADERWINVIPFKLKKYEKYDCLAFNSFNEALDEYFAKTTTEEEAIDEEKNRETARLQRIHDSQKRSLQEAEKRAELHQMIGDKIYGYFHHLSELYKRIQDQKTRERTWKEIAAQLNKEKRDEEPWIYFESLDPENLVLHLKVEETPFTFNLRKSVPANAAFYYEQAKKSRKKAIGAEKALGETVKHLRELKQIRVSLEKPREPLRKRRRKAWFEKFRWTYTSDNLLVVAGKDALTNEVLIKKHMELSDLVFHADIAGAPFALLKTEGREIRDESIQEAAVLAAVYSRAWKAKFSAIDTYWVHPNQLSKSPPSGEYLAKGAFIVSGKKNFIKRVPLRLAVGIDLKAAPPTPVAGSMNSVNSRTDLFVEITPGDLPSKKLAHMILQELRRRARKEQEKAVSAVPIQDIQTLIPFGNGRIIKPKK
ncbi:MAG: NFACT family protein [Candidatus Bathyarchaeota archaeon]|nr:MAG: NFACT family protein [Candidatus Bathyarchaeota archaeon]